MNFVCVCVRARHLFFFSWIDNPSKRDSFNCAALVKTGKREITTIIISFQKKMLIVFRLLSAPFSYWVIWYDRKIALYYRFLFCQRLSAISFQFYSIIFREKESTVSIPFFYSTKRLSGVCKQRTRTCAIHSFIHSFKGPEAALKVPLDWRPGRKGRVWRHQFARAVPPTRPVESWWE